MDPGVRSPLLDLFRKGEVSRDVRLDAARGAVAPRGLEQLALLLILQEDDDPEVAGAARRTVDGLPAGAVAEVLGRSDAPGEMRDYFAVRGIAPVPPREASEAPLVELTDRATEAEAAAGEKPDERTRLQKLATMSVMEKVKAAMKGTREERAVLVRDPNRLVASAVLSSPKLSESEIEGFARMANVAEEVLRVIGSNRAWVKSYAVAAGLVRNPKTPLAISLHLLNRMTDKDVKMLAMDRNIPEPLRAAARRRASSPRG